MLLFILKITDTLWISGKIGRNKYFLHLHFDFNQNIFESLKYNWTNRSGLPDFGCCSCLIHSLIHLFFFIICLFIFYGNLSIFSRLKNPRYPPSLAWCMFFECPLRERSHHWNLLLPSCDVKHFSVNYYLYWPMAYNFLARSIQDGVYFHPVTHGLYFYRDFIVMFYSIFIIF